jgi:hypothetical protein
MRNLYTSSFEKFKKIEKHERYVCFYLFLTMFPIYVAFTFTKHILQTALPPLCRVRASRASGKTLIGMYSLYESRCSKSQERVRYG